MLSFQIWNCNFYFNHIACKSEFLGLLGITFFFFPFLKKNCLCSWITGTTGPHRRCNLPDGIISVPHRCERLTGSDLHHLGPQQTFVCYSAQGASGTRLRSVHQWTDGMSENSVCHPSIKSRKGHSGCMIKCVCLCPCVGGYCILCRHVHSRVEH